MARNTISLDNAIVVTGLSKRTLWRRVSEGSLQKVGEDPRGRTMLDAAEVLKMIDQGPLRPDEADLLSEADAGDARAQVDVGSAFHAAGNADAAIFWWRLAAEQGSADAMQLLGARYAAGDGVEKNENKALMWISRAAAEGHAIALDQLQGLLQGATRRLEPVRA